MIALGVAALGFIATITLNVIVVTIVLYLVFYVGIPALSRIHSRMRNFRRSS
jgi:hypothetical protein